MNKAYNYLGLLLSVFIFSMGFSACSDDSEDLLAEGLSIKVYSPTKVIPGQKVDITGTGLDQVTSVIFPGGVSVSAIDALDANMISVITPQGISNEGGELVLVGSDGTQVTAAVPMTIGHPSISVLAPSDEISVGEVLQVVGTDMEFFKKAIFPGKEGEVELSARYFDRKSTGQLRFRVPRGIADGLAQIKLEAVDGTIYTLPEINLKATAPGKWVKKETTVWSEGHDLGSWSNNLMLKVAWFEGIQVGDTVNLYFEQNKDFNQFKFNTGQWGPIQIAEAAALGSGDGGQTLTVDNYGADATVFSFGITSDLMDPWFTTGDSWGNGDALIINGEGINFTKITVSRWVFVESGSGPEPETVWDEGFDLGSWSNNFSIKVAWFPDIKVGDIVTLHFEQLKSFTQFKFNTGEWGSIKIAEAAELGSEDGGQTLKIDHYGAEATSFQFAITDELLNPWFTTGDSWGNGDAIIINGDGIKFTKITLTRM